ncbi:MAG: hypothetical protein QXF15_02720 [Candidatus Aenigmatarchaeota archaeon]
MKYLNQEPVTQAAENKDSKKDDKTKNEGRSRMELGQRKILSYILFTNCTC